MIANICLFFHDNFLQSSNVYSYFFITIPGFFSVASILQRSITGSRHAPSVSDVLLTTQNHVVFFRYMWYCVNVTQKISMKEDSQ